MNPQIDKEIDLDHDGVVTAEEVALSTELYKSDTMRKQSWVALGAPRARKSALSQGND